MNNYQAPMRDIQFAMQDVLDFDGHYAALPACEEASGELVQAVLNEAARFSENVVAPLDAVGDEEGAQWQGGEVTAPSGFKDAYRQFVDGGWCGLSHDPVFGGQGLPASLYSVVTEMLCSASHAWMMYTSLSQGAINTIAAHGSEADKRRFLPALVSGQWSGTMCLTEAHSGSDLGLLRTKAEPCDDGSYAISGSKCFISSGEHDLTDNIVHLVLARLPDAPAGSRGISLFVVPKISVHDDGSLGEANGVSCGAIEHKMGIHGNATCVMNFDNARGFLLGTANKGLSCMFTFINESRLNVAQQGHGHIEASFQGALSYARERLQSRAPVRINADKPADAIIAHPDVRRMLLTQKAFAEGGRLLNYYCAQQVDLAEHAADSEARQRASSLLALLTPIAKGYLTEMSLEATSLGVQVLGGHGYIRESGLEQEYRDTRVTAIYEGTNCIQGLDLLERKVLASGGELLSLFAGDIEAFCRRQTGAAVTPLAVQLMAAVEQWQSLSDELAARREGDVYATGSAAYDYLMLAGNTTLAYFLLRAAAVAEQQLACEPLEGDDGFNRAKIATAEFFFARILPRNATLAQTIAAGSDSLMQLDEAHFAF